MGPWKKFPFSSPADGDVVWIRVWSYYGEPFLAKYHSSTQTFTDQATGTFTYPFWVVARWAPQ